MTLTKEWLEQTIAELEEERDATPGAVNEDAAMALEAMKLALASLEAEALVSHIGSKNALDAIVAFIKSKRNPTLKDHKEVSERLFQDNCHGLSNHVIEYIKQIGEELEELRSTQDTTPPAPVVPWAWQQWIADAAEYLEGGLEADGELEAEGSIEAKRLLSRRAAMLHGAEPVTTGLTLREGLAVIRNSGIAIDADKIQAERDALNSPVIQDGWVACSERMPDEDGNYWGWWSESKRQGPVWFIKSELQAQFQSSEITHWMPLPSAPDYP